MLDVAIPLYPEGTVQLVLHLDSKSKSILDAHWIQKIEQISPGPNTYSV